MSEQILSRILDELKSMNSRIGNLESGQSELHQIATAIRDRHKETDAKLKEKLDESLSDIRGTFAS